MSSTASKIPSSEWDRHKDTIVELYRTKTLKVVRAEMRNQHGFDARYDGPFPLFLIFHIIFPLAKFCSTSSWQYEMQLKRWNIRKNATRKEWQQYFSNNRHHSIPTSIDAPGTTLPPIILSKSTASKKRASRWVSGSLVEPSAPRASGSTLPGNAAQNIAASIPNEPFGLGTATQPDGPSLFTNVTNTFGGIDTFPVQIDSAFNSVVPTSEFLGSPSAAFLDVLGGDAWTSDFSLMPLDACSSPAVPQPQSSFFGQDSWDGAVFQDVGLRAENNMRGFSMLKDTYFKQKLPSMQLEHILRSKGIVLDKATARNIFGGFAPRFVAGILSSKDQSMVRKTPDLQHFLCRLSSQVPGEESALITNDQTFETKFARVLLLSVLNGFAGLDDVPMENILRFLNRFVVNKLLLDILEQSPQHVSRTLADNIFRAAIEAADTNVVKLLLDRKLVDANETVCLYGRRKYTPIQRASQLRSLRLMQVLIDAGADVNKFYVKDFERRYDGALGELKSEIVSHLHFDFPSTMPSKSVEALNILVAAGARVHPDLMIMDKNGETVEFDLLVSQNVPSQGHRAFFEYEQGTSQHSGSPIITEVANQFDDRSATMFVQTVMSLCHEANCNKCLVDFGDYLRTAVVLAARTGKSEFVQLLLDKVDWETKSTQIFLAAIKSQSHMLINFILSKNPGLDPPAIDIGYPIYAEEKSTPIAEAVRYGDEDLIRRLEGGGALDRLFEGGRFEALVNAAAEVGDTAYMRKLLSRSVTSNQAYRIEEASPLTHAIYGNHQEIVEMLLKAGISPKGRDSGMEGGALFTALKKSHVQMVRDVIATEGSLPTPPIQKAIFTGENQSRALATLHEYPDMDMDSDLLQDAVSDCIRLDTLDSFKDILQASELRDNMLNDCLKTAVKFGHVGMVEYLLDMGANPFDCEVLQATIPDQSDMLRLLFQEERHRQTMPQCIGTRILVPVMGNGPGNTEALNELIETKAINFVKLEVPYSPDTSWATGPDPDFWWPRLTPLGLAIQGIPERLDTNLLAMKKLLLAGADPDGISKSNKLWTKGSPIMTALMVAIETGREDAVNILLDKGADVNARPRIRTTRTALQYAAELGNMDMVRLLLSRGADVNSSASPRGGATALQFAAMSGNCNMVAYLLDHGAELGALPSRIDGMWPLEGAAANGRLDMIRYLWELNATANSEGTFADGFLERHCLRAMNFARKNGHMGCRDLISELSGISVDRLESDEYGAPWIAYSL